MISAVRKNAAAAPQARRRGSLDQVLIDAAMDLFASYGYRGTSLARIARAAGVTKGALYWHFADKGEFFIAVVSKVLGEWELVFEKSAQAANAVEFRAEFVRMFDTMAALNEKNPWVSRLLLIIALESHKIGPRVLRSMRKANLRGIASFRELVERGQRLGVLAADLDPTWAATQIYSSYLGLAMLWYLHGPRFDLRRSLRRQAREFMGQWSIAK
ncbi:MAG: TetR family transcriptional regulator [Candidatus Binatus sp.]|jgi:TetR/AcrR family acrAB operon transcriptional repressor|uniref:TetR/AcrR family transcriptional regulator n=1 Tax=Candidatus Binatus sp. TaxID=2811406 RepID=UPI003D114558